MDIYQSYFNYEIEEVVLEPHPGKMFAPQSKYVLYGDYDSKVKALESQLSESQSGEKSLSRELLETNRIARETYDKLNQALDENEKLKEHITKRGHRAGCKFLPDGCSCGFYELLNPTPTKEDKK